eukprot:s6686_g2.t1
MFSSPQELKALVVRVVDGRRDVSVSGLELQGQACSRVFPKKFRDELRQRRIARGKDYCVGAEMGAIVGDHCRFAEGYGAASLHFDHG